MVDFFFLESTECVQYHCTDLLLAYLMQAQDGLISELAISERPKNISVSFTLNL